MNDFLPRRLTIKQCLIRLAAWCALISFWVAFGCFLYALMGLPLQGVYFVVMHFLVGVNASINAHVMLSILDRRATLL